jgi:hypothetical protein
VRGGQLALFVIRERERRIETWDPPVQDRRDGDGTDRAHHELGPGIGPEGPERHDEQDHGQIEKMREGRNEVMGSNE